MVDEKKDEGVGYPTKILLKEVFERQGNAMMDNFPQILQWLPKGNGSIYDNYSRSAHPLRYKLNLTFQYLRVR